MQPRGSIFQNGFLGGVQFKISLKKWDFIQEKTPKHEFSHYMGLYSRVGLHSRGYGSYRIALLEAMIIEDSLYSVVVNLTHQLAPVTCKRYKGLQYLYISDKII